MLIDFHFLGLLDFDSCQELQQRLLAEAFGHEDRIVVLFCEHLPLISVGRLGSRAHIRLSDDELRARRLSVKWVGRGGGAILHSPGQLAVYPIVPLRWHGWTVGDYLRRLQTAVAGTLTDLSVHARTHPGSFHIWGRNGMLAATGVAVRDWIAYQGLFVNVAPDMNAYGFIDSAVGSTSPPDEKSTLSCLLAERQQPIKMPQVRAALVARLVAAFGADRHHLHTGHPYLVRKLFTPREPNASHP